MQKTKNLIWFTNNLRTHDNEALLEASKNANSLLALYVIDNIELQPTEYGFKKTEKYRAQFLLESINDLKHQLRLLNIPLFVMVGKTEDIIKAFVTEHQIELVFALKEWTKQETEIVDKIKKIKSIELKTYYTQFLWHPDDVVYKSWEAIPEVFTIFRKQGEKHTKVRDLLPQPNPFSPKNLFDTNPIPTLEQLGYDTFEQPKQSAFPFKGGSYAAKQRIEHYFWETEQLAQYKQTRNGLIGLNYSSKLSAWLANGSISAKEIYWQIKAFENQVINNESTYWLFFELIWRDYFKYIALKHQNKIFYLSGILLKQYDWHRHPKAFNDWINGNTPEPFVNANMIELKSTGWMSNRGRQNVASFWSKEWLQDWRIGAAYFESLLIDYDVHSNYGNWLYVSGVGNDPQDRKFNIKRQAEMYDPKQDYVNLWLS